MEFLNIGTGELALIILIAILVVGPQRAATLARQAGQVLARLRREWQAVQDDVLSEVNSMQNEVLGSVRSLENEVTRGVRALEKDVTGRPSQDETKERDGTETG